MKIHFLGIGGIGVSALARLHDARGAEVSGSDISSSDLIKALEKEGIEISLGHNVENISSGTDLIIYSNAVPDFDPGFMADVERLGIQTLSYPEALGEITKEYATIAISGTHGKTTTTAMLVHILQDNGLSPNAIVGSILSESGSNYVGGDSGILIIEAGEYKRAFMNYHPAIIGVTNIDADHLDYYRDLEDVQKAFRDFSEKLPTIGKIVVNALDQNSWDTLSDLPREVLDYSMINKKDIKLSIPGDHNVANAQLAIALAGELGVSESSAKKSLESFKGTWRRLQSRGKSRGGVLLYDDYAHHPTEIEATLEAFCSKYPKKEITLIFQPHLYSRTKQLMDDFVRVLSQSKVSNILVLPIYASREKDDGVTTSKTLVNSVNKSKARIKLLESADAAIEAIKGLGEESVIITMGAGDVYKILDIISVR